MRLLLIYMLLFSSAAFSKSQTKFSIDSGYSDNVYTASENTESDSYQIYQLSSSYFTSKHELSGSLSTTRFSKNSSLDTTNAYVEYYSVLSSNKTSENLLGTAFYFNDYNEDGSSIEDDNFSNYGVSLFFEKFNLNQSHIKTTFTPEILYFKYDDISREDYIAKLAFKSQVDGVYSLADISINRSTDSYFSSSSFSLKVGGKGKLFSKLSYDLFGKYTYRIYVDRTLNSTTTLFKKKKSSSSLTDSKEEYTNTFSAGLKLSYNFNSKVFLNTSFLYVDQSSNNDEAEYDESSMTLGLSYSF